MHSGALKLPLKAPSLGIQLPKRQAQSIGESVCIVLPSAAMLPVKEASLIDERWPRPSKYSTEPEMSALLSMKAAPTTARDPLFARTTPPCCGCEERAG